LRLPPSSNDHIRFQAGTNFGPFAKSISTRLHIGLNIGRFLTPQHPSVGLEIVVKNRHRGFPHWEEVKRQLNAELSVAGVVMSENNRIFTYAVSPFVQPLATETEVNLITNQANFERGLRRSGVVDGDEVVMTISVVGGEGHGKEKAGQERRREGDEVVMTIVVVDEERQGKVRKDKELGGGEEEVVVTIVVVDEHYERERAVKELGEVKLLPLSDDQTPLSSDAMVPRTTDEIDSDDTTRPSLTIIVPPRRSKRIAQIRQGTCYRRNFWDEYFRFTIYPLYIITVNVLFHNTLPTDMDGEQSAKRKWDEDESCEVGKRTKTEMEVARKNDRCRDQITIIMIKENAFPTFEEREAIVSQLMKENSHIVAPDIKTHQVFRDIRHLFRMVLITYLPDIFREISHDSLPDLLSPGVLRSRLSGVQDANPAGFLRRGDRTIQYAWAVVIAVRVLMFDSCPVYAWRAGRRCTVPMVALACTMVCRKAVERTYLQQVSDGMVEEGDDEAYGDIYRRWVAWIQEAGVDPGLEHLLSRASASRH
ncbi:hypothetical protein BC938DRAFT_480405, partial [Jimgerdemannia flammicorona]